MSDEGVRRLGARLGNLARRVLGRRDRQAMRNLVYVYPRRDPAELRRILDECWRHFGREALVSIRTQNLDPGRLLERVEVENAHLVDEALARGNGLILLGAHWGSWEVMSVVPHMRVVARPLDNELLERDVQRLRAKMGAEIIDRRRAARALVRGIARNGVVGMIPDQAVQPREGILVPFLGRPAWTTPAPAKLALRANATIVFTFCIPDGLGYRLVFQDPIRTDQLSEEERDPAVLTRRINDVFARRIDERPELWLWMHDRWKGTGESKASNVV
jgi:KDO2-lipid IV(A) lauroyltransferase